MRHVKLILAANTFTAFGVTSFQLFFHSVYSEEVKKSFLLKINDKEVLLPKKLSSLVANVMEDMKLRNDEKELIKPFISVKMDPVYAGHTGLKAKTFVGIPQNFLLQEGLPINVNTLVDDVELPEDATESKSFKACLSLSDKAKKFAIAQYIYEATCWSFFPKVFLPAAVAGLTNGLIYKSIYNPTQTMKANMTAFCIQVVFIAIALIVGANDLLNLYTRIQGDFQAAGLGKAYIEGGIEYYEKMKQRNTIIKKLNKNAKFTEEGEVDKWFFSLVSNVKLKHRLEYLNMLLDEKERPNIWKYIVISPW